MSIIFWLIFGNVFLFVWAGLITLFCFVRNPLPFPDRGHRCFAVAGEKVTKVVVGIMKRAGLPERFTFDAGPTTQTLLWDNTTVIMQHDNNVLKKGLPQNAISVNVKNPTESAEKAKEDFEREGFDCKIHHNIIPEADEKFVLLEVNEALVGWVLAFRRNVLSMPKLQNKRKLLN